VLAIWNGLSVAPLTIKNDRASGVVTPHGGRRVYLGTWLDVTVCTIETLQPAHEVKGSAIFESATTVLIRTGDRGHVTLTDGWISV